LLFKELIWINEVNMGEKRSGTMVLLACHCVYDPAINRIYAEHEEDRPVYESHLAFAFNHLKWVATDDPLLVISGGFTKVQRHCSESRSYLDLACKLGFNVPSNVALEEYALTSIENLLFGLYVYKEVRDKYPVTIDTISWEFKRKRFKETLNAINRWSKFGETWDDLRFFPVGDLTGGILQKAMAKEDDYVKSLQKGLDQYYSSTSVKEIITKRDVWNSRPAVKQRYKRCPLPF
jgi:hypothetical protein